MVLIFRTQCIPPYNCCPHKICIVSQSVDERLQSFLILFVFLGISHWIWSLNIMIQWENALPHQKDKNKVHWLYLVGLFRNTQLNIWISVHVFIKIPHFYLQDLNLAFFWGGVRLLIFKLTYFIAYFKLLHLRRIILVKINIGV